MILINLNTIEWRLAGGHLPTLLRVARSHSGKDQDARPDDAHRFTAATREPLSRRLHDAAPPLLALAIWQVPEKERSKG